MVKEIAIYKLVTVKGKKGKRRKLQVLTTNQPVRYKSLLNGAKRRPCWSKLKSEAGLWCRPSCCLLHWYPTGSIHDRSVSAAAPANAQKTVGGHQALGPLSLKRDITMDSELLNPGFGFPGCSCCSQQRGESLNGWSYSLLTSASLHKTSDFNRNRIESLCSLNMISNYQSHIHAKELKIIHYVISISVQN